MTNLAPVEDPIKFHWDMGLEVAYIDQAAWSRVLRPEVFARMQQAWYDALMDIPFAKRNHPNAGYLVPRGDWFTQWVINHKNKPL